MSTKLSDVLNIPVRETLNDLNDVDTFTTSPSVDYFLRYNGSKWVPEDTGSGVS